jgi:hypothetical protein
MVRKTYEIDEKFIQGLIGKTEGRRPLGRPKRRWEDNTEVNFK